MASDRPTEQIQEGIHFPHWRRIDEWGIRGPQIVSEQASQEGADRSAALAHWPPPPHKWGRLGGDITAEQAAEAAKSTEYVSWRKADEWGYTGGGKVNWLGEGEWFRRGGGIVAEQAAEERAEELARPVNWRGDGEWLRRGGGIVTEQAAGGRAERPAEYVSWRDANTWGIRGGEIAAEQASEDAQN